MYIARHFFVETTGLQGLQELLVCNKMYLCGNSFVLSHLKFEWLINVNNYCIAAGRATANPSAYTCTLAPFTFSYYCAVQSSAETHRAHTRNVSRLYGVVIYSLTPYEIQRYCLTYLQFINLFISERL